MTDDEKIIDRQTNDDTETDAENAEETAFAADAAGAGSETEQSENAGAEAKTGEAEAAGAEIKTGEGEDTGTEPDGAEPEETKSGDRAEPGETGKSSGTDKKDKQIEELNDRYKRLFAEFDNYRKRTDAEKLSMFAEGEKTVLLKVLPLIDNFERALNAIPEDQKETALAEGIEKIYRAFTDQLSELGVVPIEAVNKEFDANLHNAVMHIEDESISENTVVEEFQKGYMFKDKVLRYSMVKVAN